MAAGAFFVLFYTYPLKYIGLGEVAVILVCGPLMIRGTYFVVTGMSIRLGRCGPLRRPASVSASGHRDVR